MDINDVLDLLGEDVKITIFEQNLEKLRSATQLNLDALRTCVRLLPRTNESQLTSQHQQFLDLIYGSPSKEEDPEHLFDVAKTCLSNPVVAAEIHAKIWYSLSAFLNALAGKLEVPEELQLESNVTVGYLQFLRCSYWLPPQHHHLLSDKTISLISRFLGISNLDSVALDTLSALFSLLRRGEQVTLAPLRTQIKTYQSSNVLERSIVDQSIFERLIQLPTGYISSASSKVFGVWFQWISQAAADGVEPDCIYLDDYWGYVRTGLLLGYGDQRKYCLGIIEQSLRAARKDINTPVMKYRLGGSYHSAYHQYASLFEMIVLNRYAGQVEAALPGLTALLGPNSLVTSSMTTTLLAAAMNSKIQEGIRKLVGNWYMKHIIEVDQDLEGHVDFFLEAFLDWATEGSLFTSTISSFREKTVCRHGELIVAVIAKFVASTGITSTSSTSTSNMSANARPHGRAVSRMRIVLGVVRHIHNSGGRMFQPAVLYLLEGLVQGLNADATNSEKVLTSAELTEIVALSRFAGLPEVSSDLLVLYCRQLCAILQSNVSEILPGYSQMNAKASKLMDPVDKDQLLTAPDGADTPSLALRDFNTELDRTKHNSIQDEAYAPACAQLVSLLDNTAAADIDPADLFKALQAFWEEAERREFSRSVAIHLPPLLFHATCIQICLEQQPASRYREDSLVVLLSKAFQHLQRLSHGRSYILHVLVKSIRSAVYSHPTITSVLPFADFVLNYLNNPPSIKAEFIFEVIAAQKMPLFFPHRTYASYYGAREWHAYAAFIDLLSRFPATEKPVAKHVLDQLLQPWNSQKAPVPVKAPWKGSFQLQAMLLLSDWCITESEADTYIEHVLHALKLEPWPRFRFLLEWILARLYIRFPGRTAHILEDLARLDLSTPVHISSLMKLGLLVAPYESEEFIIKLATQLSCFSASQKVHIRHEAHYVFPLLFDLAQKNGWKGLIHNPAFVALNDFIRGLDKFKATPWTIRTLRLDPVNDFTLVKIFQGEYLTIESPERELAAYQDFITLQQEDEKHSVPVPPSRIPVGEAPIHTNILTEPSNTPTNSNPAVLSYAPPTTFLQTKATFSPSTLYPTPGPPSQRTQRPTSVILIASLIDNPTNLGGLSRISESFGLEALYIDDLKKTASKDFKATSVTSEKHMPIHQLKADAVPQFLIEAKTRGYTVVGIEQTDRSGVLGEEGKDTKQRSRKDVDKNGAARDGDNGIGNTCMTKGPGTLPQKCVLVLGSEKEGISKEVLAVLDRAVEIKTVGVTRSLNVQTAGGIAVYEWWREWGRGIH